MPTQIVQQGSVNTTGLVVPGAIVQIIAPTSRPLTGAPNGILGLVGTASWGPVSVPTPVGGNDQQLASFGPIMVRSNDLGTAVAVAVQQGVNNMVCVRVTDGSDLAASANILDGSSTTGMTVTGKYTGSRGNSLGTTITAGSSASSSRVTLSLPGLAPETYDNITGGVIKNTVTVAGTYTTVPTLTYGAPNLAAGAQAIGTAVLGVTGTPTIGAAGINYSANDFVTLSNGVVIQVNTVSGGNILTFKIISTAGCNTGAITSGSTPANPVAQVSSSGSGTGATVNLVWGIVSATMTMTGTGYTGTTTAVTVSAGSGAITANTGIWLNAVSAINNGQSGIRGPSLIAIATQGAGVGTPVLATTTLAGGSDGVAAITSSVLIGVDTVPRKGMYALRNMATSVVNIADLADSTQWAAMMAFALSEGTFVGTSSVVGDTITNAASELSTAGIDGYGLKVLFGDWVYWQDNYNNGVTRLLAPATFWAGERAATAIQNSTLNAPTFGIVGTQKSNTGTPYTQADLSSLITARMDVIATPSPGGNYYSPQSGKNCASNPAIWGENYTMMTNFLAKSIGLWSGTYIGKLQTPSQQGVAKSDLDNFFNGLWTQGVIGVSGTPAAGVSAVPWQVVMGATQQQAAAGYQLAYVRVTYLSVIMFFVVSLEGGQSVQIAVQNQAPTTGF